MGRYSGEVRFSARTGWDAGVNDWTEAVEARRATDPPLLDLSVSNPSQCGLGMTPEEVLTPLHAPGALRYTPDPFGMEGARGAVAAYYREHGSAVDVQRICLTTSTSEAYSFLFRLLCNPGDEVLIARPSYPLFDLLARLDDVALREYPLLLDPGTLPGESGWRMDLDALERAVNERTRAIVVVHPNNPTGHYVAQEERSALVALCARRGLALLVDEVFLDYAVGADGTRRADTSTFAGETGCLCFTLSGLSKICALPQMKASWIVTSGPQVEVREALHRLEIIADTFLSMNAPVQFALPSWLKGRHGVQSRVRERLVGNLRALDRRLQGSMADRLGLEGGWTAVLRVPRFVEGEPFAEACLRRGVLVQPGALYGMPESRCVVSLLTDPDTWRMALERLPI